ncbi:FAD/NAD(P)-binding domain-containing protein [Setomelanomma holmii]|uniref:FAD/NAD(P)-binding domain-containing protein n=1 Tax=Setomelanomma holmii TaxID=210430 RepID=A0A9P4LIK9_9PLEO|nr:FAD/NAD(P)-binding domain-containing protein [Setomelanomma holmii]
MTCWSMDLHHHSIPMRLTPRTVFLPLELEDHPLDEGRRLRVVVVGAGISGITSAVFLPAKVPNIDLTIYERNSDVVSVRCDVPAHAYQATFEPSTTWSTAYASGAEIKAYWKGIVEKHELGKYIRLHSKVTKAEWSEEKGKWLIAVETEDGNHVDEADFLITGIGHFSDPRLPSYPGMDDNGASGLPILPPLQKAAARIDHYARNKTWVAAAIGGEHLEQFTITKLMSTRLGDRVDLLNEIIPDFAPNCRRLTPGPGYLEALAANNVNYVTNRIERFTRTGIQTKDGTHREVDAIICATGHDINFSTAFPIVAKGINLQEAWRPGGSPGFPDSYLSIAAPDFPNFLILLGPNATGPAGTLCHSVENQVTYCARVLRKASTQGIRSMAPTAAATRDFRAYCESFFLRTVMSEYCSSWHNGGIKGGRIHGIWPGSAAHVNAVRREPRWEDWEYTYLNRQGNRFAWLGNGWTMKDVAASDPAEAANVDLTPWLRAEALGGNVDLRDYHEQWYAS